MAVRVLGIDIMSYLKGDGFKKADEQVGKLKQTFSDLKGFATSGLGQIAVGYFGISQVMNHYNKSIEAANYQLEQEKKLEMTMRAHGFRDEQINSIKSYAGELQKLGVVGDEVTLAGAQRLATYGLTENSIKKLLPAMQDILVKTKGLAGTGGDAEEIAKKLAEGLIGEVGGLKEVGIILDENQQKLMKTGSQHEKIAMLVDIVKKNIGEQNKEMLKTPEGRIASVNNDIGDVYENIGMLFRESRAWGYELIGNNLLIIESFLKTLITSTQGFINVVIDLTKKTYNVFSNFPPELKTTIKLIAGFFAISSFPIVAGIAILEDLLTAFQGGESVVKNSYDALMRFLDIDLTFDETVNNVKALWKSFEEANGVKIVLESILGIIEAISNAIGIVVNGVKLFVGSVGFFANGTGRLLKAVFSKDYSLSDANLDNKRELETGFNGKMVVKV